MAEEMKITRHTMSLAEITSNIYSINIHPCNTLKIKHSESAAPSSGCGLHTTDISRQSSKRGQGHKHWSNHQRGS